MSTPLAPSPQPRTSSEAELEADVVVIGAGSAGLVARRSARAEGASVLLCDPGPLGTTCARVGCMPSKLLIAAAEVARSARGAARFGVDVGGVVVDAERVFARVRAERDRFAGFVVRDMEALGPHELLRESVRLTGATTLVSASGRRIRARSVVIATGSAIIVPATFASLRDTLLTSDTIFELKSVPRRLAVVGGGIIGLELGQAMAALGSEVTLFDRGDQLGPTTDPAVTEAVSAAVGAELRLRLGGEVTRADEADGIATLEWRGRIGAPERLEFDAVLVAVGRAPRLAELGLEVAGATLDARGRPQLDPNSLAVRGTSLFIAGDVSALRPLLHEAADEGRIAGRNAAAFARAGEDAVHRYERRTPLAVVFSHPQIAMVGMSYRDAQRVGARVGAVSFADQGRARVQGDNAGLLRVYGEPGSGRLLGMEMIGPAAEHLAHLIAWSIQGRMTVIEALERPFYHPVIEEGLRTALRDLARACGLSEAPPTRCLDCGPGA